MRLKITAFLGVCFVVAALSCGYYFTRDNVDCRPFGLRLGETTASQLREMFPNLVCDSVGKNPRDWYCDSLPGEKSAHSDYDVMFSPEVANLYALPERLSDGLNEIDNPEGEKVLEAIVIFGKAVTDYYKAKGQYRLNMFGLPEYPRDADITEVSKDNEHPSHEIYKQLSEAYGQPDKVVKFPGMRGNAYYWDLGSVIACLYAERLAFYYAETVKSMADIRKRNELKAQ